MLAQGMCTGERWSNTWLWLEDKFEVSVGIIRLCIITSFALHYPPLCSYLVSKFELNVPFAIPSPCNSEADQVLVLSLSQSLSPGPVLSSTSSIPSHRYLFLRCCRIVVEDDVQAVKSQAMKRRMALTEFAEAYYSAGLEEMKKLKVWGRSEAPRLVRFWSGCLWVDMSPCSCWWSVFIDDFTELELKKFLLPTP